MKMEISDRLTQEKQNWARETLQKTAEKLGIMAERNRNGIPYTTGPDGRYDDRTKMNEGDDWGRGTAWWTNGFFGGILWQLYSLTGKDEYREIAEHQEELLDPCFLQFTSLHHDVGFTWMPTAAADWRLMKNPKSRTRGLHAATLLAGRFNPAGNFIRAWNDIPGEDTRGWAIIDCMMNLSLLYWASEETGDPRFKEIAMAHADTAMRSFIRADGSSNHIVEFDPEKGNVLRTLGGQGYENGSAWTRGQAWAVYGFFISYRHTGKKDYLASSVKVADYFTAHMPASGIIPIDFDQPEEPALEDSCGACAAASGLISLAGTLFEMPGRDKEAEKYLNAALRILTVLTERCADFDPGTDAIVQNCSGAYHSDDHHITMIYADYYYFEALLKLAGKGFFLW